MRLIDRPPRLATLDFLYFAGDQRFGALGVSPSELAYEPRPRGAMPVLGDVAALHDLDLVRRIEAGEPTDSPLAEQIDRDLRREQRAAVRG